MLRFGTYPLSGRRMRIRKALIVIAFVSFMAGLVVTGRVRLASMASPGPPAPAPAAPAAPAKAAPVAAEAPSEPAPPAQPAPALGGGPDFTRIAAQAVRGVVNISSLQVVRTQNTPFSNDPFFNYFFGGDQFFGGRDQRSLSLGSGVVISPDGYIVTNNHVVGENEQKITVTLGDKREMEGLVVGTDPATDIALLKIEMSGLPTIPWGDSTQLKIGEWVLAIGSPFQLSQTVTAGIVSAVGRNNVGLANYEDFIQTDAAINPGNSGGALINPAGQLVGINTGIFSESGGYQGIGFAVPSNLARKVVDDLRKYGEVHRGAIAGIASIDKLTPQWANELNAPDTNGALIVRMMRNSDAYNAGLRPGDVIVRFDGTEIDDPSQFYRLMADAKIGSTAKLRVLRQGRPLDMSVKIVSSSHSMSTTSTGR
jgi:Do/DeqQ family serine protease